MKGVILAGGKGSRMSPLTLLTPKPLVPIMNVPVIDLCISWLKSQGITEIAITTHHQAGKIQQHCGDGEKYGVKLVYFYEKVPMGTAGGLQALKHFLNGTFVVISSDVVNQFFLQDAIAFHYQAGSEFTIITTPLSFPDRYGIVIKDKKGRIRHFLEKPARNRVFSDQINTGIYIVEPSILNYISCGNPVDFSKDLFPILLKKAVNLFSYELKGYWIDIGHLHTYHKAHRDHLSSKYEWVVPFGYKEVGDRIWMGPNSVIEPTSKIKGPVLIGKGCYIGSNTKIMPYTVIGDNSVIGSDCCVEDSILWEGVVVNNNTKIFNSVIASHVHIEEGVIISKNTMIAEHTVIKSNCRLGKDVTIKPYQELKNGMIILHQEAKKTNESVDKVYIDEGIISSCSCTTIYCPSALKSRMVRLLIENLIESAIEINFTCGVKITLSKDRWLLISPYENEDLIIIYTNKEDSDVVRAMADACKNQLSLYQGV